MSDLEERLSKAIEEKGFNAYEFVCFKGDPNLALLAGASIGYATALEEQTDIMKYVGSRVSDAKKEFGNPDYTRKRRVADAKV